MADQEARGEEKQATTFLLVVIGVVGFLLLALSLLIHDEGGYGYIRELTKELGIVLLAVTSVSLLYERFLAKKCISQFLALLRIEVERGESNAAACASLGIMEIFPSRAILERKYPFEDFLSPLNDQGRLRVVGRSLFNLMGKSESLRGAVRRGAVVELCLCDPRIIDGSAPAMSDLEVSDIYSVLSLFARLLADWVDTDKPAGNIELRFHRAPTLDSYTTIDAVGRNWGVWDISFRRDISHKRIFFVDLTKPLGRDLHIRYQQVWESPSTIQVFAYSNGQVRTNELTTVKLPNPALQGPLRDKAAQRP